MEFPLISPKYYISLLKAISTFVKSPHNRPDLEKSVRDKIIDTLGLFILKMILLIPLLLFFALIYDPENVQGASMAERFSPIALLLLGGFILPLVEEVAFRLSLVFNAFHFSLSSSALAYYFLTKAIFQTKISTVDDSFFLRVTLALVFGVFIYLLLNVKIVNERAATFWQNNFRLIFYTTCLIFAWMHISRYELMWLNILLLPILTLPQLMSAIIYGYTRVRFGFVYPLILHCTMNFVAIGLSLLPLSE